MKKEQRVNVRISVRAYKELKKRARRSDATLIGTLNAILGV